MLMLIWMIMVIGLLWVTAAVFVDTLDSKRNMKGEGRWPNPRWWFPPFMK